MKANYQTHQTGRTSRVSSITPMVERFQNINNDLPNQFQKLADMETYRALREDQTTERLKPDPELDLVRINDYGSKINKTNLSQTMINFKAEDTFQSDLVQPKSTAEINSSISNMV